MYACRAKSWILPPVCRLPYLFAMDFKQLYQNRRDWTISCHTFEYFVWKNILVSFSPNFIVRHRSTLVCHIKYVEVCVVAWLKGVLSSRCMRHRQNERLYITTIMDAQTIYFKSFLYNSGWSNIPHDHLFLKHRLQIVCPSAPSHTLMSSCWCHAS